MAYRINTMVAYVHILFRIVCMICYAISPSLDDCTNLTTICPTSARWFERAKFFMCSGKRSYVCLMSDNNSLREGCIFNSTIPAGTTGCPYTKKCDNLTRQPVLVAEHHYLSCPPDHDGCPPRNHPGYSILDIYKYPICQRRNTYNKRTMSPDKIIEVQIAILPRNESNRTNIIFTTPPNRSTRDESNGTIIVFTTPLNRSTRDESNGTIIISTILVMFVFIPSCVLIIVIKKFRGLPEFSRAISKTIRDLNNRLFVRNSEGLPGVPCGSLEANNHSNKRLLEHHSGGNE